MAFISAFISTVVKMLVIVAFAAGGIVIGKKLRDNKDAKAAAEAATEAE